jgi:hypothetical protein
MLYSQRPTKWLNSKRYLGAFLADDLFIDNLKSTSQRNGYIFHGMTLPTPKRPESYHNFINRILQAFDVLKGKADALYWYEDIF